MRRVHERVGEAAPRYYRPCPPKIDPPPPFHPVEQGLWILFIVLFALLVGWSVVMGR